MCNIFSRRSKPINWSQIETTSPEEQTDFVSKWEFQFEVELVSSTITKKNVKRGDHLAFPRYILARKPIYTHHAICRGVGQDTVTLLEYSSNNDCLEVPTSGFEKLGKISSKEYKFDKLVETGAYKVVWPKELKRYTRRKVIKRAKERLGETKYHPLSNNCEHFASWCICGLNVSLQARLWRLWVRKIIVQEVVGSGGQQLAEVKPLVLVLLGVLLVAGPSFVVEFAGFKFAETLLSRVVKKGFEIIVDDMKKAFDETDTNDIPTDELLYKQLVKIIKREVCSFCENNSIYGLLGCREQQATVDGPERVESLEKIEDCSKELLEKFIKWCEEASEE